MFKYIIAMGLFISSCTTEQSTSTITTSPTTKEGTIRLKFETGIRSILEDSKGNIWFGSHQEGLALLNKASIIYYTQEQGLSDNQVRNIYEDKNGIIWFECGKGLSYYDGSKIMSSPLLRDFSGKNEWKLHEEDLWFKGDEMVGYNAQESQPGAFQYDGSTLSYRAFPIQPKEGEENYFSVTTPFFKGNNGQLWIGTYGAVIGYDGTDFTIIDNDRLQLTEKTGFLHIRSILEDSKGRLWIGNNGIGVIQYSIDSTFNFTDQHKLSKKDLQGNHLGRVFSIGEDQSGNIWFGTVASGLWRYDGKSTVNFGKKDGLLSENILAIYRSKSGELWFGGAQPSGVYRLNGHTFERIY